MKKQLLTIVLTALLALCVVTTTSAITYEYDDQNRLTKVTYDDGKQIIYTYDAVGNRTAKRVVIDITSSDQGETDDADENTSSQGKAE
jgi:YD repeat-containing protein